MRHKSFIVGDWVLRKVFENKVETTYREFTITSEDPDQIYDIILRGLDRIKSHRRREELSWNGEHLKKYYM